MIHSRSACQRFLPRLCAATALLSVALAGTSRAADEPGNSSSAEVGATFTTVDSASNSNKSAAADFRITRALTSIFGASLSASAASADTQIDLPVDLPGKTVCSYEALSGTAALFARRPSLGRITASYSTAELESKCGASGFAGNSATLDSDGYSLAAEYYLPELTLTAQRTVTSFGEDSELVADIVSAAWYPITDLSVSASAGRVGGRMQYGFAIEHQPEILGELASVSLSFSTLDAQGDSVRTISLAFAYHFGARVDLKTRDRRYR